MTTLKEKYGSLALVAGASEGIGAAYARHLAAEGLDLVLVARRMGPLQELATELTTKYGVYVECLPIDLSQANAAEQLTISLGNKHIGIFIYNAAKSHIGHFEAYPVEEHLAIAQLNMITPMLLTHSVGSAMLGRGRGAVIILASLAGFQGTGYITTYSATKAFDRIFAESLWYEWKDRGVDVLACCAGATNTPGFNNSKPGKTNFFAPRVQQPEEVVIESFEHLGKRPSFISGGANKIASFFMQRVLSRKAAITTMGDTTKKMYMQ